MVIGYARISSKSQMDNNSFEQQEQEIHSRYQEAKVLQEQFTGTTIQRPVLNEVMEVLVAGDTLVVTKLDRLARTTTEGIKLIQELFNRGVAVHVLNIGLLEDSAMGKFFITTLLAVAELERSQIVDRTVAGKAIAKQSPDFVEGRPPKYNKKQIAHALQLLEMHTYSQVAEITGISKSTLVRAKRKGRMACKRE